MVLVILFIVAMIVGGIRGYRLIVTSRKPGQRANTLYEWSEKPLSSWKYEAYATTAILVHTLSVLVLGLLALRASSNQGLLNNPLFARDTSMIAMVWFVQCGCISLVGYQVGTLLISISLIVFRREPVAVAITEKGIGSGKNLVPWGWFSHFSIDSNGGILRLYSAFSPDLPSLTLKLPESIPLGELDGTIHGFLASHPSEGNRAWYQTKFLLLPTMLLVCLLFDAVGWLASPLSQELALFVFTLLTTLLIFLGGLVLNLFGFGVLTTSNKDH